jgi:hypothetical protein
VNRFCFVYLAISVVVSTRIGLRLHRGLASTANGNGGGMGSHSGGNSGLNHQATSPTPNTADASQPVTTAAALAAIATLKDHTTAARPSVAIVQQGYFITPAVKQAAATATVLRQRILRLVYGSIACSIGWLLVMLIANIASTKDDLYRQLWTTGWFRVVETLWYLCLLTSFWPQSNTIAPAFVTIASHQHNKGNLKTHHHQHHITAGGGSGGSGASGDHPTTDIKSNHVLRSTSSAGGGGFSPLPTASPSPINNNTTIAIA